MLLYSLMNLKSLNSKDLFDEIDRMCSTKFLNNETNDIFLLKRSPPMSTERARLSDSLF